MDAEYYSQAVPEPCKVLGLTLLPLSVGHVILLHRIESVFVTGSPPSDPFQELSLAVAICAQPYAEALDMLLDPETTKAMLAWAKKLTRTTWVDRALRRKAVAIDIHSEWAAFEDYIRASSKIPNYSFNAEDARQVDCPHVQIVRATLQRAFGIQDKDIMDRSWSQSLWDCVTLRALDGQVQMIDRDAISEAREMADKIAAAIAKRKGAVNGAP